ncbi:class I SAM-dependent methyltransferase [Enterobacter mori]
MNTVNQREELSTLPYSRYSYCMPEYLTHESAWLEHAPFAFWLVREHQPSRIVELGTYAGYSYFAFCQAATYLPHKTDCFAVDTWQGDEQAGYYPATIYERVRTYNEEKYQHFSTLIRSDFDSALHYFKDGAIDLLHIDGSHTYASVKNDFINWLPKMSSRGIILFHDTQVRRQDFGVYRLWEELCGHYPHFEFTHGFGLGVLAVGSNISESLLTLLNAESDSDYSGCARYIYASLGKRISEKVYNALDDNELRTLSENLGIKYADLAESIQELSPKAAAVLLRLAESEAG